MKHTVIDDNNDSDVDDDEDVSESDTTAMSSLSSPLLCSKSLSDNRSSDTIASLKVFWLIRWQRSITTGFSALRAMCSLTKSFIYIKNIDYITQEHKGLIHKYTYHI